MNVHVSYKAGKTPDVEREFHHQLQKLQRRLQVFKPDLVHLHAVVDQENNRSASTSLNLRLPSGQMAAQKSGENALAATKSAFADLFSQVTKHKELLRGHWTRTSTRRAKRAAPLPAEPSAGQNRATSNCQQTDAAAVSNIETWLSANLRQLEAFVDRELNFQVEADRIREGPDHAGRSDRRGDCERALPGRWESAIAFAGELVPSAGGARHSPADSRRMQIQAISHWTRLRAYRT